MRKLLWICAKIEALGQRIERWSRRKSHQEASWAYTYAAAWLDGDCQTELADRLRIEARRRAARMVAEERKPRHD